MNQKTVDIEALLQAGEGQTVEFKTSFGREAIETLVAFANAKGGVVLVGVTDRGLIRGVSLGKETLNDWIGRIKSATSPAIIPDIDSIQVDDKYVVRIQISEYPVKPVNSKGRYFKRVASSNHQLALDEIADLYLQSLQTSWDAHEASGESLGVLSLSKIEDFIRKVNAGQRFYLDPSPLLALAELKLIVGEHPTWAAMLLFAEEPLRHHIHLGRFKTPSTIIDDRQITDTLFSAVEQAMKFIIAHINVSFEFDGGLQRQERFAYPLPALREVLLNAIVHRDYTNPSDIQIKIFDDRLTIFSPGNLCGGLTIADLQTDHYSSQLRNKLIAEAFYLTNNIEKYGSGFVRIRQELKKYPEITFKIEKIGAGILVTFRLPVEVSGGVSGGVSDVLSYIRLHPGINSAEMAKALNIPKRTLERWIKRLREENKIAFQGAPKTGGYFIKDADNDVT